MEHAEIRRKLVAYLDNAVSDEDKEEIKKHLGRCGGCRGEIADLELTVRFLKSLPEVEPPPWLAERIMANVRDEAAHKWSHWRRLFFPLHVKLPIEVLAMLFICVTGYYLTRMINEQPPVARAPEVPQKIKEKAPTHAESNPPATSAAPRLQAGGTQRKMDAPQSADLPSSPPAADGTTTQKETSLHPAKISPVRKMAVPELRPTDEGLITDFDKANPVFEEKPASAVKRGGKGQAEESLRDAELPEAVTAGKEEITLAVADPSAATGAIEEAVTRFGGRINGHSYSGERHLLFIRISAPNYPRLLDRLGRVGTVQERPQIQPGAMGMIDLVIRW
jgi:hypothetical protein